MVVMQMAKEFPNGYTRIPHEILNAVTTGNFTAQEHRIINLIIRTTYGCGKDCLILHNWAELSVAGIYRSNCRNNIERLETSKAIIVDWDAKSIKLNPDYSQWLSQNELANSNSETYKKLISRQLVVSESLTNVSESLTNEKEMLVNHEQQSLRITNNPVSESLTTTEATSNDSLPDSTPINSIKDSIKENKEKEASDLPIGNNLPIEEDAREPNIYLTVRRKIQIKYPLMKLTETDVGRIINKSKEPFYEGGKIDYWFHIIDKMPEWDKLEIQNVYGILAYGERAWPDYKKAHNIQAFFGS